MTKEGKTELRLKRISSFVIVVAVYYNYSVMPLVGVLYATTDLKR